MPSSSDPASEPPLGLEAIAGELLRGVADVEFFLAPFPADFPRRADAKEGVGDCLKEEGVPRSLPCSTLRFFGSGFLTSDRVFRLAMDAFGAGRFFDVAGFGVSDGDASWPGAFFESRTRVPYSFCADAIACTVSWSRFC